MSKLECTVMMPEARSHDSGAGFFYVWGIDTHKMCGMIRPASGETCLKPLTGQMVHDLRRDSYTGHAEVECRNSVADALTG